jgi:hypothetical protein
VSLSNFVENFVSPRAPRGFWTKFWTKFLPMKGRLPCRRPSGTVFAVQALVHAGFLAAAVAVCAAEPAAVTVTDKLPSADGAGALYLGNRPPLAPSPAMKLPPGAIAPRGWLRHQLELDAAGLVGRMPEISRYLTYEGNGWVGPASNEGWEEMPYWLRGYGDLGYALKDEKIIAAARRWIDGILANQRPDGYFGPLRLMTAEKGAADLWPHMLVLDALHSYHEFTGDERVPKFILGYFQWQNAQPLQSYKVGWGALRWADNMAIIYWLYNKTGEPWLLDLARKIHENSVDYTTGIPNWHNVNLAQGIREPAEYGMQAGEPRFLDATELNYRKIMDAWGQFPGGGFAGDENIRKAYRDPRQGFETCGYVEFMRTFEMMTRISGRPLWSDRCEEIAFNSLPAALTPDHKALHYVTCANSIQLDNAKKGAQFQNQFAMLAYKPGLYDYRCCPHNYGMGWSHYAGELWLATADMGLCASLYAASDVSARVADGTAITIAEETDYPFGDTVTLTVSTPKPVVFPLYLRVPRWCGNASLKINAQPADVEAGPSSYIVVRRAWKSGDRVTLHLPMRIAVRTWPKQMNAASVDYGPLTFSLKIGEQWQRFAGTDDWPEFEVFPTSPWNYGLVLDAQDPAGSLEVVRKPGPLAANPFTHDGAPLSISARARKIPAWKADSDHVVGVLQQGPIRSEEPLETVTLIPMGAARLRITSFPVIGEGPEARAWATTTPAKVTASFVGGESPQALNESMPPSASSDQDVPRFTWWPHKGTAEWVQYEFETPRTISASSVYWFDDTGKGECRVPTSWRLVYRDGDAWKPVEDSSDYGTARDRHNDVSFKPVTTSGVRLELQLGDGVCAGVLEWRLVDRALRCAVLPCAERPAHP